MSIVSQSYNTFRAGRFYFWSYEETVFGNTNAISNLVPENMVLNTKNIVFNKGLIGEKRVYVPNTYVKMFRSYPVAIREDTYELQTANAKQIREAMNEYLLTSPATFLSELCSVCGFSVEVSDSEGVASLFDSLKSILSDVPFKALTNNFDPTLITTITPATFFQTAYSGLGLYVIPNSIKCNSFTVITPSRDNLEDIILDCTMAGFSTAEDYSKRAEYFSFSIGPNNGISKETPISPGVTIDTWRGKPHYMVNLYSDNSHSTAIGDNYVTSYDNRIINFAKALIVGSSGYGVVDDITTTNNSNQAALGVPSQEVELNGLDAYKIRAKLLNYLTSAARFDNILESTIGDVTCYTNNEDDIKVSLFKRIKLSATARIGLLGKKGIEKTSAEIIVIGISIVSIPGGIFQIILKCGVLGDTKINDVKDIESDGDIPNLSTNPT